MANKQNTVMSLNNFSGNVYRRNEIEAEPDVMIVTSDGLRIPAHASILASISPVFESIINRPKKNQKSDRIIPILGVPSDAVSAFVRYVYSSRCIEEEMEKYGIHLLTLSHVYLIPQLKKICTRGLAERLTKDNVIDLLPLAELCDAPELYLRCMKLVSDHFKTVEKTEAWKFMQENDPWLELDILQFIDDFEKRKKRSRRHKEDQSLYLQLSEAMDCLEHICTEGCTNVGPYDKVPSKSKAPCNKFASCEGLQMLIKHYATCKKRVNGGCLRCKRMWQLLKLHSSICEQHDHCRVPLCRQFKLRANQEEKQSNDAMWKLLVRKVMSAKAISSFVSTQNNIRSRIQRCYK